MVHRAAMAEVFITDAVPTGPDSYLVAAQWPRDHALYHPDPTGRTDPLLLAETLRQALVYLAHRYHAVPLTHRFIGCGMDFAVTDGEALRVRDAPLPVVLEARWVWTANRPPRRYGMRLDIVLTMGGRACGHGSLEVLAVDARTYGILRGGTNEARWAREGPSGEGPGDGPGAAEVSASAGVSGTPSAGVWRQVPAARVGRLRGKDSVLEELVPGPHGAGAPGDGAPAAAAWRMRADLRHAILFDHPSDHLPLMVTLEGCRQLGHLLAHDGRDRPYVLASSAMECRAFAELGPVALVATEPEVPDGAGVLGEPRVSRAPGASQGPGEPRGVEPDRPGGQRFLRIEAIQAGRTVAVTRSVWSPVRPH